MKFNKWTLGLATSMVICLIMPTRAAESKIRMEQTAVFAANICKFADVSTQHNLPTANDLKAGIGTRTIDGHVAFQSILDRIVQSK